MFIHNAFWFKKLLHLKETHGSRWGSEGRNYQTTIKKKKQLSAFSLITYQSCCINDRNGGRRFDTVKGNSIRGWKERPKYTAIWLRLDLAPSHRHCELWHILNLHAGLCRSARSCFCALVSLCPASCLSQKSPVGLLFSLANAISSKTHTGDLPSRFRKSLIQFARYFFSLFFFYQWEQGTAFTHLCGFTDICRWWKRYPESLTEYGGEKFPGVGNLLLSVTMSGFQETALFHETKTIHLFKLYRCLGEVFHSRVILQIPSGHSAQAETSYGSPCQTNNAFLETIYVISSSRSVWEALRLWRWVWHVIELSAREWKSVFALCAVHLVVGAGWSRIFTHGFPSVKAKWRGALGANTKTGGSGRVSDEHKHTHTDTHKQKEMAKADSDELLLPPSNPHTQLVRVSLSERKCQKYSFSPLTFTWTDRLSGFIFAYFRA